MEIKKHLIFFTSGGLGYGTIELLWRGRTHWTMIIAGGICFVIFSIVSEKCNKSKFCKAFICAAGITLIELIFGVIFNLILGMGVWDYSNMAFNFLGQICPLFSLCWFGLAFVFLPLANFINVYFQSRCDIRKAEQFLFCLAIKKGSPKLDCPKAIQLY